MSRLRECPSPEKLALLREGSLTPEEREEMLLHIADCNYCAVEYAIFDSLPDYEEQMKKIATSPCPSPEIFALLLEDKLDETRRADVLSHMAACGECAMAYSTAREMQKLWQKPIARSNLVLFSSRYLARAAAIVLLAGGSFFGGALYARRVSFPIYAYENEYARIVQTFESSPLYWSRLNDSVRQVTSSAQATGVVGTRGSRDILSVKEILAQKRNFDRRLSEIVSLSDADIDAVLSVDGLNILAMTSSDIESYAASLKEKTPE